MNQKLENKPKDLKIITEGIINPEGPVLGPDGNIYLVSADESTIYMIDKNDNVSSIGKTGGRPNGLAFNSNGELFIADAGLKSILKMNNGKFEVFVDEYDGSRLDGPNDLCFLPNGNLLFTDPIRKPLPDPSISPIYSADSTTGKVKVFANDLAYPNGIELSNNFKNVLVSESRANRLVSFFIDEHGNLLDQKLIRRFRDPAQPDGLAVDSNGFILQTLPGIRAICYLDQNGKMLDLYHIPDWSPSNIAFGGKNLDQVFVCGGSKNVIYSFKHNVPGNKII
ncbi:MAG: hypothetical protein CL748_04255 [Chloroflexi bacterium]|nr:hypothetical protein [Chloroflexota bacterium]